MKTAYENLFLFNISSLKQDWWYLGVVNLCQNTHFTYKIFQYNCFNWIYYNCAYVKLVGDVSEYNKLSDF